MRMCILCSRYTLYYALLYITTPITNVTDLIFQKKRELYFHLEAFPSSCLTTVDNCTSLEMFKVMWNGALCNLIQWVVSLSMAGVLELEVFLRFSPSQAILWYFSINFNNDYCIELVKYKQRLQNLRLLRWSWKKQITFSVHPFHTRTQCILF